VTCEVLILTGRSTQRSRRQQGDCFIDNLQILTENPPQSPMSFRPTSCFVLSRARRRQQANTSRRIKRSSTWYWWPPFCYAIVGLCVCEVIETVEEKRFYWHNPSHSAGCFSQIHEFCFIARTHYRYQSFDCSALCSCHGPCAVIPIWFPELNERAAYLPPRHSFCNACDSTPRFHTKCCPLCCPPGTTCIPALNPSEMTCFLWRKPKSSP